MCGWSNAPFSGSGKRNLWTRNSNKTYSDGSKPLRDTTLGSTEGWYAYLFLDSGSSGTAILQSEVIGPYPTPTCFELNYNIYTETFGMTVKLRIFEVSPDHAQVNLLGEVTAGQNEWKTFQINLSTLSKQRFILEVDRPNVFKAHVAVDDIRINPGACQTLGSSPRSTPSTTPIPTSTSEILTSSKQNTPSSTRKIPITTENPSGTTDTPASSSLSCNFESENLCSWKNDRAHPNWKVIYPDAYTRDGPFSALMPRVDHTKNNVHGHFAYVLHEKNESIENRNAVMTVTDGGRVGSGSGPACLTLWFYMRTEGEVVLNVTVRAPFASEEVIAIRQKDHGDKWNKLELEIPDESNGDIFEISALARLGKKFDEN